MDRWTQDVRFALRTLRRRPLFASIAVLTLGLGIGATTAMFSVVDGVLLRGTPFGQPARLADVWRIARGAQGAPGLVGRTWDRVPLTGAQFAELQARSRAFEGVASHNAVDGTLTGRGAARRVKVGVGSASLLRVLGVQMALGRWFLPGEESFSSERQGDPVAVVSGEFWRTSLDSDPAVLGTSVELDDASYTIVGVLPEGFRLRYLGMHWLGEDRRGARDVWVPWGAGFVGNGGNKETIARLAPTATLEQAQRDTLRILAEISPGVEVRITARMDDATAGLASPLLLLLMVTALLLAIACLNTATLHLGELQNRTTELATRAALGAGRIRVVQQLVTESLLLGLVGELLGVVLAVLATRVLVTIAPPLPRVEEVGVDLRMLGVATVLAIAAGLLFGILPALASTAGTVNAVLRSVGRVRRRSGADGALIAAQLALTVVVLVAGGLLARSLDRLMKVDPGFDPTVLTMVHVTLPTDKPDPLGRIDRIADRLRTVPGVGRVSAATRLPFPGLTNTSTVEIRQDDGSTAGANAQQVQTLERYHETMGIPIIAGRGFTRADREGAQPVLIVSENFARRYWPARSPIGERVRFNGDRTIVGISGDVKRNRLGAEADPVVYTPLREGPQNDLKFVVRADANGRAIDLAELRQAVQELDPDVPVVGVSTMAELIRESATDELFRTLLMAVFGCLAAFLAGVGVFGVTARSVSSRSRELGIRMALGARVPGLVRLVLRASVVAGLIGTALGLLGAAWASRALSGLLFGVEPFDPPVFVAVGLGVVLLSVLAGYVPARRLVSVDPASVLRAE